MAPPVFTISSARQKFFDLFQAVTSRPGRKVIITSRGAASHAVLVGESYLNELESAAKRLHAIEAGHGLPADSFKLVGSGRITVGVADPVGQIRLEATAAAEKKLASLAKVP
jgi:PHD/YefM family antitoxin component YafN of YafNO toxin-antitoxin module